MFLSRKSFLGTLAATAVAAFAGAASAQEVTLRLHQFLPAQANVPKLVLDVWADRVEADSEGRIKVQRFPSMQLGGKPPELYDQARDGIADVVWTVAGYTPGRFPHTEVFELPFFMNDAGAASRAYWELHEKYMKDADFKDVHILATWVHGPGMLHTDTAVESPDDLRGLKVRGGSRQVNALLTELGATPVGMPVPAIPEAISKGVLDGTTIPWEVTTALKIPELVGHHTEFTGAWMYNLTFIFAMNKDRYESLPDDLKAVIDQNSGVEFSVFAGETQAGADGPAREIAESNGNSIVTLDEAATAEWRERAQPIYDAWIADMDSKGIDGQALIEEAQALMTKYTTATN